MQLAQRPGGAYALKANPHFPQTRASAIERFVAFRFYCLRNFPKGKHRKCYRLFPKSELPADIGLAISLRIILPFSCIKVERELHRSIVNPGKCHDFMLQRE